MKLEKDKGYKITAKGEVTEFRPANKHDYTLAELKEAVGGYIEVVYPQLKGMIMVVNEEGKLRGLPVNALASALYEYDTIVGDVVVCPTDWVK